MNVTDIQLPANFDLFDWFILGLRIAFIALIYFFLYQVARVTVKELITVGQVADDVAPANALAMPSPMSALEIIDPAESSWDPGARLPLDHYTTIGRSDTNSIVIDDGFVSGSHAELIFDRGRWWIQDLHSTNGTQVNNEPVAGRVALSSGDIVTFGRVHARAHI